nr:endonuclease/exonuclease/phosphatase family protein [Aliiroseovarius subalbicans]
MSRKGPGLLLRDLTQGRAEDITEVLAVITTVRPDILHLMDIDHDLGGFALFALQEALRDAGLDYPHAFSARPNAGVETGLDMDGNGELGEARDAQGYGRYTGQGGMAILSRFPLGEVRDFTDFLWADLPGAIPPLVGAQPFPSPEAFAIQRLPSVNHWDVEVLTPDGPLHLLAFHATTPVYDGDEDRNGRRNHDEISFWARYLDGDLPMPPPAAPVVILGGASLDPEDGEGRHDAIRALLRDPRLQDPRPASDGARQAANSAHTGDAALDTVDYNDPRPGNLRVDYVLPSAQLSVIDAGTHWPVGQVAQTRHHMVWVDVTVP